MVAKSGNAVEAVDDMESRYMGGFFNITQTCRRKLNAKRKRKGLGELKPREKNVFSQAFVYGTSLALVKTLGAPLERTRIIMQTKEMYNVKQNERPTGGSISILSSKI